MARLGTLPLLKCNLNHLSSFGLRGFKFPSVYGIPGGVHQHRVSPEDSGRLDHPTGPYQSLDLDYTVNVHPLGKFRVNRFCAGYNLSIRIGLGRVLGE